jgi:viroplasmin and RNaseH domain-containing protein
MNEFQFKKELEKQSIKIDKTVEEPFIIKQLIINEIIEINKQYKDFLVKYQFHIVSINNKELRKKFSDEAKENESYLNFLKKATKDDLNNCDKEELLFLKNILTNQFNNIKIFVHTEYNLQYNENQYNEKFIKENKKELKNYFDNKIINWD